MTVSGLDEDRFNTEIRKFLKKVGINSQREIERAVREGLENGTLTGRETLKAEMTLELAVLGVSVKIGGDIALS